MKKDSTTFLAGALAITLSFSSIAIFLNAREDRGTLRNNNHRSLALTDFADPKSTTPKSGNAVDIAFVAEHIKWGSVVMRGQQFIEEWQLIEEWRKNNEMSSLTGNWNYDLKACVDIPCADVCIFIGPCHLHYKVPPCCKVKVLDIVDKYLANGKLNGAFIDKHLNEFDVLVVNSNYMKNYFEKERNFVGEIIVLLHHSDPRWHHTITNTTATQNKILRFGYSGTIAKLRNTANFLHYRAVTKQFPITFVDTDKGGIPQIVDFSMDLSVRPIDTPLSRFKTSAKVATAAAMGHNIITTWDEAVKDCLPKDYPFALKDASLKTLQEMMKMASKDYAGDQVLWKRGLGMMEGVNRELSLPAIAAKYQDHLIRIVHRSRGDEVSG